MLYKTARCMLPYLQGMANVLKGMATTICPGLKTRRPFLHHAETRTSMTLSTSHKAYLVSYQLSVDTYSQIPVSRQH
jgi:hypothetical protein